MTNKDISITITNGLLPIGFEFEEWLKVRIADAKMIASSDSSFYYEFSAGKYEDGEPVTRKLRLSNHNAKYHGLDVDVRYCYHDVDDESGLAVINCHMLNQIDKWIDELKLEIVE